MKKFNTSPISGMQELLPAVQVEFNRLKSGIASAYHAHGYQSIETPIIDRTEILFAKAGGDTEKQIYRVVKTAESADDADQALRFDHTVPLARYVVEHQNDLAFPFKVTQIGRNFRGERAQKGRFREFYQCDVDVIGWQTLPLSYDADVILTLIDAMSVLPLTSLRVRVSNRKILSGLLESLNLDHQSSAIFNIIDHAEKVPPEATAGALSDLGIGSESITKLLALINLRGNRATIIPELLALGVSSELFATGVAELDQVLSLVESNLSLSTVEVVADLTIVRGLDYYTGTVFETIAPDHQEIGSICGGGRYEALASNYTSELLPGVGGSIGLTRLFSVLQELDIVKSTESLPIDICLVPMSEQEIPASFALSSKLRTAGKVVDINLTNKRLGDKLTYAAKTARFAVVIGGNEVATGKYMLKNLATGEQTELKI